MPLLFIEESDAYTQLLPRNPSTVFITLRHLSKEPN